MRNQLVLNDNAAVVGHRGTVDHVVSTRISTHVWQFVTLALKKGVIIHFKYFHFPQSDGRIEPGCGEYRR